MLDYFRGAQPLQTIDSENFRADVIVTRLLRTMEHDLTYNDLTQNRAHVS
jgi:hypothetical protein